MQARAVRKKDEVFSPFETGEVSGDYEMEIRSAFEFVEEGKVLRYAAGGDEQVAAIGGEAEPIENPCGGFSEFTEDGGHERAVFDSFADGLGLNAQVGGVEEFVKPLDEGGEAGFFVQVGSVNPVPGKVFHENGGNIEFLAEHESEGGDVAKDEVGLRFPEGFSGVFEGRFVESKEALESGDGLVEVMLEGGFWTSPASVSSRWAWKVTSGERFSVQNQSGRVLNTRTASPGSFWARARRTATARVACPNP